MTKEQMESACKKVQGSGWHLQGTPMLTKGQWTIPFRYDGSKWQTFVNDREIKTSKDEAAFIDEIEHAVGRAIRSSQ
jgi:hypothetical protein